jgi:hypothetical protein
MALVGRVLTVECPCSGTPHTEDTINFHRVLSLAGGMAAISAIADTQRAGEVTAIALAVHIFPVYLAHAVASWTFVDDAGEPLPLVNGDVELPFPIKYQIADAADDLFGEEVTRPLVGINAKSSPTTRTNGSTSPKRRTSASHPKPSAPSLPATSAAFGQ